MKPAKSNNRKSRNRTGSSLLGNSPKGRRRGSTFKLESLEERLLLSTSPIEPNAVAAVVSPAAPNDASYVSTLPTSLADSVKDATTVATVAAPSTATTNLASAAASAHVYSGTAQTFVGPLSGGSTSTTGQTSTTTSPGQYNPGNQQAALAALDKLMTAQPQYLVMPTGSPNGGPDVGTGPAGYAPAQVAGAYGINNVSFGGGIVGNGAGQTIALVDLGDYPGFVNSNNPNFDSSALHIFDQEFGLPDPPSFMKYSGDGSSTNLPGPDEGWFLEELPRRRMGPRHGSGRQHRSGRSQCQYDWQPGARLLHRGHAPRRFGRLAKLGRLPRI